MMNTRRESRCRRTAPNFHLTHTLYYLPLLYYSRTPPFFLRVLSSGQIGFSFVL